MYSVVNSAASAGIGSFLFRVETDCAPGMPCFEMVGLLSSEVRESRERVRVALSNCGISLPSRQITVNLSPAGLRKAGAGFDLPIAVGVLLGCEILPPGAADGIIVIGELGLGGEVKPVRGILPIVREGLAHGYRRFLLPEANAEEGSVFAEAEIIPVATLSAAIGYLSLLPAERNQLIPPYARSTPIVDDDIVMPDYVEIIGQTQAKHACEIAAAGFHNLLFVGPPGTGKSMLAQCLPSILPPLSREESLEVSGIYSVVGQLKNGRLMKYRPFVSPHHTVSQNALAGGGSFPKPGAITLAHRGVLFLDELPEFGRSCIETLRQPLEDRKVMIQRTSGSYVFPAEFMLVAAMNPCPCGFYPDRNRCTCTPAMIKSYLGRISGPILDRIDLCTIVEQVDITTLYGHPDDSSSGRMAAKQEQHLGTGNSSVDITRRLRADAGDLQVDITRGLRSDADDLQVDITRTQYSNMGAPKVDITRTSYSSAQMLERIMNARAIQEERYAGSSLRFNADLRPADIEKYCHLGPKEQEYMERIYKKMSLSLRGYHRILKVSRTIADLNGSPDIKREHLAEAVSYRASEILK